MRPISLMLAALVALPSLAAPATTPNDDPTPITDIDVTEPSHELSVEAGFARSDSAVWNQVADNTTVGRIGLRGGYALNRHVLLVGGYGFTRTGQQMYIQGGPSGTYEGRMGAALTAHELEAGARYEVGGNRWAPYLQGTLVGQLGRLQLDDNEDVRNNPGQVASIGLSAGLRAVTGIELRLGGAEAAVRPAVHVDMGYLGLLPYTFGDRDADGTRASLGRHSMSGFVLRSGVGVRF